MAACSSSSGNDDGPVTFEGAGPITWVQGKDNSGGKVQARIDEWNKANPGEEVKLIELSVEADQQRTSLVNAARINSNAYDVVSLDNVWVSEFAANRWAAGCFSDSACFVFQAAFVKFRSSRSTSLGVRYPRAG